jgi:hypothetical protein
VAKSCEENLKLFANDTIPPLRYVPRFVGVCQLSNWEYNQKMSLKLLFRCAVYPVAMQEYVSYQTGNTTRRCH